MPESRCDRCGHEGGEMHVVRVVGWSGELRAYKHADGSIINGDKIDLCTDCRDEFTGMLQSAERHYPDPSPPS